MKQNFIILIFLFTSLFTFSQTKKESFLKPNKIGFLYNYGSNENFVNDDPDYKYETNTYKLQAFYTLGKWKSLDIELMVQPQVQFLKHQLINEQFVTPDQDKYLEKRIEFTKPKTMNLYGLEFGLAAKKRITNKLNFKGTVSLGFMAINTRTERLAKGFTFIENFSFGFSHQTFKNSFLYVGTNLGHVSNLNFQKPNDGYNIVGLEMGFSFLVN